MVISIMGWINESFVRLMAITAFSSISPRTLGIFARATMLTSLGFLFARLIISDLGKSITARIISAAKSAISDEMQPTLFIHVTAIP